MGNGNTIIIFYFFKGITHLSAFPLRVNFWFLCKLLNNYHICLITIWSCYFVSSGMQLLRSYPCSKAWPTLMHIQAALSGFSEHLKQGERIPLQSWEEKVVGSSGSNQKEGDGVDLMKTHYYIHAWILNEKNKVFILGQNMQFAFLPCFGFVSFACLFLRHIS